MATSGRMTAALMPSSPGTLMPASMTAKRCRSERNRRSINGTPKRLFRLASVMKAVGPNSAPSRSLVEVLPTLPVTPMTGPGKRCRQAAAMRRKPACGSATTSCGSGSATGCATTAQAAPWARASLKKSWPSRRAVFRATNASPVRKARVSVPKPVTAATGEVVQVPWAHAARSVGAKEVVMRRGPSAAATIHGPLDGRRRAPPCRRILGSIRGPCP